MTVILRPNLDPVRLTADPAFPPPTCQILILVMAEHDPQSLGSGQPCPALAGK
jgi:hypothetical protein